MLSSCDVPPSWVKELAALQASNQQQCHALHTQSIQQQDAPSSTAHPVSTPTTTPRPARKRPSPDKAEIEELTAKAALLEVQLKSIG